VVLRSDDAVSVVALTRKVDVSKFVIYVEGSLHFGLVVSESSGLHYYGY
jgi:hypothetical protein